MTILADATLLADATIRAGAGSVCEGAQGGQGVSLAVVVCLSVCLLRGELVRAPWPDRDETFGGGRGQVQERLSPEPAQSAKVCAKKRREI